MLFFHGTNTDKLNVNLGENYGYIIGEDIFTGEIRGQRKLKRGITEVLQTIKIICWFLEA